ncbi:MAG: hypothetical protein Q9214_007726 [Letrouitia sp. 1 TL-2023]
MKGGSFNRVTGITLSSIQPSSYVIRSPRSAFDESQGANMRDQVVVLRYLKNRLPVATVLAYDSSVENELGSQYVIQGRLAGKPLAEVFPTMTHNDRLHITSMIAKTICQIETIRFPRYGRITAPEAFPRTSGPSGTTSQPEISPLCLGRPLAALEVKQGKSLKDLIFSMIEAWRIKENPNNDEETPGERTGTRHMWVKLREIAQEMDALGMLEGQDGNVLWHWDFAARNILVDKKDENWEITGILDWDDAITVPLVLSRVPPVWLWQFHDNPVGWDGDYDLLPGRALDEREQEIEIHFEEAMARVDQTWFHDAYGVGLWVRRWARFAFNGFRKSEDWKRYHKLVEDWDQYKETNGTTTKVE